MHLALRQEGEMWLKWRIYKFLLLVSKIQSMLLMLLRQTYMVGTFPGVESRAVWFLCVEVHLCYASNMKHKLQNGKLSQVYRVTFDVCQSQTSSSLPQGKM